MNEVGRCKAVGSPLKSALFVRSIAGLPGQEDAAPSTAELTANAEGLTVRLPRDATMK